MRPCTSATPPGLAAAENRHRHTTHNSHNTQQGARKNESKYTLFYEKDTQSSQILVLEDTSHQTRPKIAAGDATLLLGSISWTRLTVRCAQKRTVHIHTRNLNVSRRNLNVLTKHEIAQLAAFVSLTRAYGIIIKFKALQLTVLQVSKLEEPHSLCNATPHTTAYRFHVCLRS
jgi:hypothetical protein